MPTFLVKKQSDEASRGVYIFFEKTQKNFKSNVFVTFNQLCKSIFFPPTPPPPPTHFWSSSLQTTPTPHFYSRFSSFTTTTTFFFSLVPGYHLWASLSAEHIYMTEASAGAPKEWLLAFIEIKHLYLQIKIKGATVSFILLLSSQMPEWWGFFQDRKSGYFWIRSFLFLRFSLPSTHIFVFMLIFGYECYLANTSKKSSFSIIST